MSTATGKLELIVGPMRSNKTAELLRRIEIRRQYAKQDVMLLKPADATKAEAGLVGSRNRNGCGKMEAVKFRSADPWPVLPVLAATEQRIGKRFDAASRSESCQSSCASEGSEQRTTAAFLLRLALCARAERIADLMTAAMERWRGDVSAARVALREEPFANRATASWPVAESVSPRIRSMATATAAAMEA